MHGPARGSDQEIKNNLVGRVGSGRVGSGEDVFEKSRVGLDQVGRFSNATHRVGSPVTLTRSDP